MSEPREARVMDDEGGKAGREVPDLRPNAADVVGRWVYLRSRYGNVTRHWVQAQRGGVVLELAESIRPTRYPRLVVLAEQHVVLIETDPEHEATCAKGGAGADDKRRLDHLQQLYRARLLEGFVRRLPGAWKDPDFRRVLDAAAAPPAAEKPCADGVEGEG